MGVRVVIDDFGTGCFSLSHFRQSPVDVLRIAGEFTRPRGRPPAGPGIARHRPDDASARGLARVADGA